MTFTDYWAGLDAGQKRDLARRARTSYVYLSQLANGHRRPSAKLCRKLEKASDLRLSREALRPDLYI